MKFVGQKVSELRKKKLHLHRNALHLTGFSKGAIAQSVEQRTENPCVAGSIPAGTTKTVKMLREVP